jgi:hypothetical protein
MDARYQQVSDVSSALQVSARQNHSQFLPSIARDQVSRTVSAMLQFRGNGL